MGVVERQGYIPCGWRGKAIIGVGKWGKARGESGEREKGGGLGVGAVWGVWSGDEGEEAWQVLEMSDTNEYYHNTNVGKLGI